MSRRTGGSHALAASKSGLGPVPFARTRATKKSMGFSQADTRRPMKHTDQHGRPWSSSVENHSGMPTGLIANDFQAPWLPDQSALVVNPENPAQLWIDYGRMYRERRTAMKDHHKLAVRLATDNKWPMPTLGEYSADYRRVLGDPPKPLQTVKAAAQGNRWILGFTDVVDERLVEFVRVDMNDRDLFDEDFDDGVDYGRDDDSAPVSLPAAHAAAPFTPPVVDIDQMDDIEDFSDTDEDDEDRTIETFDRTLAAADEEDAEEVLEVLEEKHDAAALGGRTVRPETQERVARQAPRRPGSTSKTRKRGKSRGGHGVPSRTMPSLRQKFGAATAGGPKPRTLADGARPGISDARIANERVATPKGT